MSRRRNTVAADRLQHSTLHRRCGTRCALLLAGMLWLGLAPQALGDDPDNCLLCHQYRGLSRFDPQTERIQVYYTSAAYHRFGLGAHARVACTDCHERSEVAVIPHKPISRVDCTRQCHLQDSAGTARRFSHEGVARALDLSVHAREKLDQLEFTGGPLLQAGQSQCLYCHDEPLFRSLDDLSPHLRLMPRHGFDRCDTCHAEQVPVDVGYYLRHVGARLQAARPPLDQAQVCAVCHADPLVLQQHNMPNAVASFVRSFHGKAALLGDNSTADCVSCHVGPGENTHLILAQSHPRSAVHPDSIANSCRSTRCHPGADVGIAAAAVHLDLPSAQGTLEFWVAVAFIVLTAVSFGPSLVLCLLELFQIVIGRQHHAGHAAQALTERVLSHPQGRARLARFTVNQRLQHWLLVVLFVLLALTGFPMKFADHGWARVTIEAFGGLGAARQIHHWSGIALIIGFFAHFVYALTTMFRSALLRLPDGRQRGLLRAIWEMPMLVQPGDLLKAHYYLLYLLGLRKDPPSFGRFTIKEKFEYIGVAWGTTLLGITGLMLWAEQVTSHYFGGRILNIALIAHTYEAFLAIIHVGILHIVNVMFSPHVFPLSLATITGQTPVAELAEQHADFVRDAARELHVPEGPHHD
ncbi:MAG: hypothetical protein IPM18_16845 [Phycisphaerales bacterium]|nr:hypothetical protein [Phycisphaerales bacterium]